MKIKLAVEQTHGPRSREQGAYIFTGNPPLIAREGSEIRGSQQACIPVQGEQALPAVFDDGQQEQGIACMAMEEGLAGSGAIDAGKKSASNFATHTGNMEYINGLVGFNGLGGVIYIEQIGFSCGTEGVQGQTVDP
ncbi:MAG: hypothetical protein EBS08_00570 [Cytophagia bacterium]|nr:hypothetical protein [Cytophagia bacterium]